MKSESSLVKQIEPAPVSYAAEFLPNRSLILDRPTRAFGFWERTDLPATATKEEFEALLEQSFEAGVPAEGSVVGGKVIAIESGQAIVDIGHKMEGRVDLKEFSGPGATEEIDVGDVVEVYLDRVEDGRGEAVISRDKARREEAWDRLEKAYKEDGKVDGAMFNRVKGGFTVDLGGGDCVFAWVPGRCSPGPGSRTADGDEAAVPDHQDG